MKLLFITPLFLLLFSLAGGCQQEERSTEHKLIGYWQSEKVLVGEQESPGSIHIDLQDNEYRRVYEIGSWTLSKNEDTITFMPNNTGGDQYAMKIIRITDDELWLTRKINGQLQEEHYVKKK